MGEKTGNSQHPILQKHIKQSCSGNTSFHIMWIWFLVLTLLITLSSKFSVFSLRRKKEKKNQYLEPMKHSFPSFFSFSFFGPPFEEGRKEILLLSLESINIKIYPSILVKKIKIENLPSSLKNIWGKSPTLCCL